MRRFGMLLFAPLFAPVFMVQFALAGTVHVQLSGEVTDSEFGSIPQGSEVTGYYTYDDALPDYSVSNPDLGTYFPINFSLGFEDGSTISSPDSIMTVNNNASGTGTADVYQVAFPSGSLSSSDVTLTGSFDSVDIDYIQVGSMCIQDDTGTVFDSDAIPDPDPLVSANSTDCSLLWFEGPLYSFVITFTPTSLSVLADPQAMVEELIEYVMDLNIMEGISNSLDSKLEAVLNVLDDLNAKNDVAATNSLEAFINAVEAQRGKTISEEEADELMARAQAIIDILSS